MKKSPLLYSVLISLIFQFLFQTRLHSQSTFVERIGSANSEYGEACQPTSENGIILVEVSSTSGLDLRFILTKTDSTGAIQWSKLYQVGQWCVPFSVLQAKDEGFIVYGSAADTAMINNNNNILFLYKTDNNGTMEWNKQFSLSANDIGVNLVHRKAGGYLAFSIGDYNLGISPNAEVTAIDINGNIIWSKQYIITYGMKPTQGVELSNGNICFVSTVGNLAGVPFNDAVVTMLDSTGNLLWSKSFSTYYDDEPNAVAVNSSNDIFITGRTYIMNREWDSFLLKLDQDGNKLLSNFYDAGTYNGEIMRCIVANEDGSCTMLGDVGTFDERDITMIQVDSNASVKYSHRYEFSPSRTNYPYELFTANDGGLIFTGDYDPSLAFRDAIIVKTKSNGDLPCYDSSIVFSEHNEIFSDSDLVVSTTTSTITIHNFPDSIPFATVQNHIVCQFTTNIESPSNRFISEIYPNPTNDFIYITTKGNYLIDKFSIYSIDGKIISQEIIKSKSEKLLVSLKTFASGVYFIECCSGNTKEMTKVIKE